jgi:hypothetical protein
LNVGRRIACLIVKSLSQTGKQILIRAVQLEYLNSLPFETDFGALADQHQTSAARGGGNPVTA